MAVLKGPGRPAVLAEHGKATPLAIPLAIPLATPLLAIGRCPEGDIRRVP